MPNNEANTFYRGGKRFSLTPINLTPEELDAKAGEHGYPDFASFQAADPAMAQTVLAAAGMATPEDRGQRYSQVATKDDLDTKRLGLLLGGTVAAGFLPGLGAGASTAPTSLAASGIPITTGTLPAALPGAVGLGATGSSGAAGLAGMLGSGAAKGAGLMGKFGAGTAADFALKTGSGIANAVLQNSQNNKQLALQREQLAEQQRQFNANLGQRQGEQASAATQLNPFTQAQARQKQALLASLLGSYTPTRFEGGKISGGAGNVNASTFAPAAALMTPEAMQANEEQFTANQQGATGGKYQGPDYNHVGYGALANLLSNLRR